MTHGKRRGPKGSPSHVAEHISHVPAHISHGAGKRRRPRSAPSIRSWVASATLFGLFVMVTGFVLTAPHAADDLASTTIQADPAIQSGLPADGATPPLVSAVDGTSRVLTGGVAGGSLTVGGGVPQVRTGVPPVVSGGGPLTGGATGTGGSPASGGGAGGSGGLTSGGGVPQVRNGVPPVAGGGPLKIAGAPAVDPPVGTTTSPSAAPSKSPTPSPSKSPTPSPSKSPTPTASPTKAPVASVPIPSSWPNASDTGVPSGVTLTSSGGLVITVAGTLVSGLNVSGCIDVKAVNVVITKSRISCNRNSPAIRVYPGASVLVSHSEIDGLGGASSAIGYDNYTLDAVDIHDCVDGITLGSDDVVENSYVHDLARGDATHNDAIQTVGGSNDVVRGNTLEAYRASTGDLMNSAIQTGHLVEALSDVVVEGNYMDGGNYTVNAGSTSTNGFPISGYVFRSNVFGPNSRYGPVQALGTGITFDSSNVWASNGKPVN